jgi:hypothetical protein
VKYDTRSLRKSWLVRYHHHLMLCCIVWNWTRYKHTHIYIYLLCPLRLGWLIKKTPKVMMRWWSRAKRKYRKKYFPFYEPERLLSSYNSLQLILHPFNLLSCKFFFLRILCAATATTNTTTHTTITTRNEVGIYREKSIDSALYTSHRPLWVVSA